MNEEQLDEYSALELIYPDIIKKQSETSFDVFIESNPDEENPIGIRLSIYLNPEYPRDAPSYSIKALYTLDPNKIESAKQLVSDIIDRDIGNPMMFDIIEGLREWLINEDETIEEVKVVEDIKKTYETYTQVTPEIFLAWQEAFNRELKQKEELEKELVKERLFINGLTYQDVWSKPTGREIFERGNFEVAEEDKGDLEPED